MSKVISPEAADAFSRWRVPAIDEARAAEPEAQAESTGLLTAEKLHEIQSQAYEEGFALGKQEGLAAGATEIQAQGERLQQLMSRLAAPFEALDEQVEQQLLRLAITMARQLVRREMKAEPGEILPVVREAMGALPAAARSVELHLHPEDAALVRERLSLSDAERTWRIVEDPVLTRGDCRVSSDTSQIDARVETRLNAVIASMFGGGRQGDIERGHGTEDS